MEFPLVRGMPYATGLYFGLTPFLYTNNAILRANDQDQPGEIKANRIKLVLNNEQSVLVYAWESNGADEPDDDDDPLQWKWDRNTVQLIGPGSTQRNWSESVNSAAGTHFLHRSARRSPSFSSRRPLDCSVAGSFVLPSCPLPPSNWATVSWTQQ